MALALRGVATGGGTANNVTLTKPTGLALSDIMLASIGLSGTVTPPSGWTLLGGIGPSGEKGMYAKLADSGDVAASSFNWTGTDGDPGGVLAAYSGGVGWGNTANASNVSDTVFVPSVTVQNVNSIVVALVGTYNFVAVNLSATTWTSRVSSGHSQVAWAGDHTANAGATGGSSIFLQSSQTWAVMIVELIPFLQSSSVSIIDASVTV